MGESEAAMIISHIFSALKYMHKNGFVHRNIRPETILFESEGGTSDIKFADLITATLMSNTHTSEDDKNMDFILRSAPHYRAPELLMFKKAYDYKCDLWSCGCILYNMITGIPPFFEYDDE